MSKIVVIVSGKGGVGKSTVAFNIAYEATKLLSADVILISADPAKSLEFLTDVDDSSEKVNGWFEYINRDDLEIEDVLIRTPYERLFVVCSSVEDPIEAQTPEEARGPLEKLLYFKKTVESNSRIGLVIVDTPGSITKSHYYYARLFSPILVTAPTSLELRGAKELLKLNEHLEGGHRITKAIVNKAISKREIEKVEKSLDLEIIASISSSQEIEDACNQRKPVSLIAPKSRAARELKEAARAVIMLCSGQLEPKGKPRVRESFLSSISQRLYSIFGGVAGE